MTVVVDAGPLIALAKTGGLEALFRLHPRVLIPPAVRDEAILVGRERGAADALHLEEALRAGHLEVAVPQPRALPIPALLGRGEEETILLAIELRAGWVLVDDLAAREAAARSFQATGVPTRIRGTLGIIVSAFQAGHLPLERAVDLVSRMSDRPDIWIHPRLCRQVIESLCGAGS